MTTMTLHKSILRAALALLVALAAWALQATYAAQVGAKAVAERGSIVAGLLPAAYASRATTAAAASAPLIISELRVRGPNGANDEFIEIYNNSDAPVTVAATDASAGFAVAASNGVARFVIPNGTLIPARGHYLGVNSVGYSLASYPAGNGTTATGDATYTTDIPDNAGVALFCTSNAANFTLANRLDAVGSTSEANTLYKEGTGYSALTPFSIDYSFYRKLIGVTGNISGTASATSRFPQDTNNNAADFLFVDTNGTSAGAGQRLGAPGPQNLSSPVTTTADVARTLLDSCVAAGSPPNRVRDYTSDPANNSTFGTLDLRRTFTNNTGANITRLRFRIQDLTTFPAPSGVADLRPRTSTAVVVTVDRPPCGSGTSNVTVQGTTLEQPPSQPNGGGFNSSLSAGTVTLTNALAPGASIDVRFLFGIQQAGFYRLAVTVEALPGGGDLWLLCGNTENNSDVEGGCVFPPTIAKSFNPTTINAGAVSQLTLTFTNPAGNAALTNLAVTDNLPAGVTVAATPGLNNTCGGTVTGATAGSTSFSLSDGMLAAGASSCQVQVNVTSATPGMVTNTTGNVTATGLGSNVMGGTASATLTVNPIHPPTVAKAFSPTTIASGGASTLTITLGNANPSLALTGAALTDTLPTGVTTVAATAATTCGGMASQTSGSVSLNGGTIPANGSCTLTAQVTGTTGGTFNNTIAAGDLTTTNGGANAAGTSATLTVVAPPTIAKSFNPTTINAGATSQITLTLTNPAGNAALTNLAVTDNLPAGATVAATPGLVNTCGGTVTGATAGSTSFSLSGGTLAAGASCQVQVNVTSSMSGAAVNTTGNVTATGSGLNVTGTTASATLNVNPIQPPTVAKAFSPTAIAIGGTSLLTITLGNANPSLILTGAALTDTLPAGVTTVAATAATTCGGTAAQTANSVSLSGGTIPAGGSCTLSVQVTSATSGAFNNTIAAGDVATSNGGANAAGASATLTVTAVTSTPIVTIVDPFDCTGPGDVLTVTVAITNPAVIAQPITFSSTFPAGLVGLPGTGTSTVGPAPTVTATGATFGPTELAAGQTATVTYQVQVGAVAGGAQLCINTTSTFSGAAGPPAQACTTVNCPTIGPGLAFPATSEVSDQKAGSVLVYNLYSSSAASPNTQNTRLSITNTNPALDIAVHLFFVDGATCSIADAIICLTKNQTASFLASDLDPGTTGYIVAVASDLATGCPVNFNFLIGDAHVKLSSGHQANLGAEAFAALAGGPVACDGNSVTATLAFDGVSYNRAPRTLAASSIPARNDGNDTLLVVNRFGGNLAIGAATLTGLFGIFYDDAENALSFTFSPGTCQFRSSLSSTFPRTTPRLETFIPAGRSGWLRLYSASDIGLLGAVLNLNPMAGTSAGAFNQGRNLHKLTLTSTQTLIIPIFPPNCLD